jgi:16S rRNA processing protein RimM
MAFTKRILLGRIIKIHPYKGTVTVELSKGILSDISVLESVFLEIEGKQVPFFINQFEDNGSGFLKLNFEGYESSGKMEGFNGCRIFIDSEALNVTDYPGLADLSGFSVYSQDDEFIGKATRIINSPGQLLLQIYADQDREILIPLHEDLIVKIDEKHKTLKLVIADGLVDVN